MAFDFGAALSSIGQLAPAQIEGAEIRRQRLADAEAVKQRSVAAADEHAARQAQTAREQQLTALDSRNANRFIPISSKPERGEDGKYYMLFMSPDNKIQRLPVDGNYDPNAEKKALLKELNVPEDSELGRQVLLNVKPETYGTTVDLDPKSPTYGQLVYYSKRPGGEATGAPVSSPTGQTIGGRVPGATDTTSSRFDPITGTTATTHTIRKPLTLGPTSSQSTIRPPSITSGGTSAPPSPSSRLDAQGQIPPRKGLNDNVRAAANELLSGREENNIEPRLRPLARSLAMKYGWKQTERAPLSPQERGILETDRQITDFSNEVIPMIEKAGLQNANSPTDSVKAMAAWAEYKAGRVPSDPFYASIIRPIAAISIAGAAPWTRIGRGKYTFDTIQQHLPHPWQTPQRIYENVKWLRDNVVPSSERSITGQGNSNVIVVSPEDMR